MRATVTTDDMIFIPCKYSVSHNEGESTEPRDVEAGANVLLLAILKHTRADG